MGRVNISKRKLKGKPYTYVADFYVNNRRVRTTLGTNKYLAKEKAKQIEQDLVLGIQLEEQKGNQTLSEFTEEYFEATAHKRRENTSKEDRRRLRVSILPVLGKLRLNYIGQKDVEYWLSRRQKTGVKPGTINRELIVLKAMMNAAKRWKYIREAPTEGIQKLKDPQKSVRFLSEDEAVRLLEAAQSGPYYLYGLVLIAMHSGLRWSELRFLRWQDIDLKQNIIRVENMEEHITKSGKVRFVPMTKAAKAWFEENRGIGFVFGNPEGKPIQKLRRSFQTACKRANVKNFRFHDLRHTFCSYLVMQGKPLQTVMELMGHSSLQMVLRYAHLSPQHMAKSLDDLNLGVPNQKSSSHIGHICKKDHLA